MVFISVMSFSMFTVNKQLALFFDQVGIRNYPKKTITTLITAYVVFSIHCDVILILKYFVEISKIYEYISRQLFNINYNMVYLTTTAALYYLADFGFDTRNTQKRRIDLL